MLVVWLIRSLVALSDFHYSVLVSLLWLMLKASASKTVNIPQRLWRLLNIGSCSPLVLVASSTVTSFLLWAALVVLESGERSDKNRGSASSAVPQILEG